MKKAKIAWQRVEHVYSQGRGHGVSWIFIFSGRTFVFGARRHQNRKRANHRRPRNPTLLNLRKLWPSKKSNQGEPGAGNNSLALLHFAWIDLLSMASQLALYGLPVLRRHNTGATAVTRGNEPRQKPQIVKRIATLLAWACLCASTAFALPRDKTQTEHFRRDHPCPSTGHIKGPCSGYNIDHKKPLMMGGADRPENMQWIKTSDHKQKTKKDFENCKAGPICLHRGLKNHSKPQK